MFYSSYVPLFVTRRQMSLGLSVGEERSISRPSRASPRLGRGVEIPPALPCAVEKVVGGGEARERRAFDLRWSERVPGEEEGGSSRATRQGSGWGRLTQL